MLAAGSLLGQIRPADLNNQSLFIASIETEVMRIEICNTTASPAAFRLFHDDLGATFDQSTALRYDKNVPANDSITIEAQAEGSGIQIKTGGELQFRSSVASALTVSAYGETSNIAPPGDSNNG